MPFGSQCLEGGGVRFRLWAPAARQVQLCLADGTYAMTPGEQGWHHVELPLAGPGSRYRFMIDGDRCVPDPASRFNPGDVHGASEVIDPYAFDWKDDDWRGRPWHEAVIYELHAGTFTPEGTFHSAIGKLDYLMELGVTAVELMPVAAFPGKFGWGYDGVLPFATHAAYGRPEDFKLLVQEAHARGMMVLLDVVYNHLGPEGNYLARYAPEFFTEMQETPWGASINLDHPAVRSFFIHNALYWLHEYHVDGLRLDAVHAIPGQVREGFLKALAAAVREGPGRERLIHLVLENDANEASYLARAGGCPRWFTAQWNDDLHHSLHCLLTRETGGYYADFAGEPARHLGRSLAEGFAWQGEPSPYHNGAKRGERSGDLSPAAFVSFLQNHDHVGNRLGGERLHALAQPAALRAALAILLLAPSPPLLFMGEEFAARTPFFYFCDLSEELRAAVRAGREQMYSRFAHTPARGHSPDPFEPSTFAASRLDWGCLAQQEHAGWLDFYRALLELRRKEIVSRAQGSKGLFYEVLGSGAMRVGWRLGDGSTLTLLANLDEQPVRIPPVAGRLLWASGAAKNETMLPWSVAWYLAEEVFI